MPTAKALKIVWTSVFLSCKVCLFCEIPRAEALIAGRPARRTPVVRLNGVVYGDDFAGYESNNNDEEGQRLAREFYEEIKIRDSLASAMADIESTKNFLHGTCQRQPQSSRQIPRRGDSKSAGHEFAGILQTRSWHEGLQQRQCQCQLWNDHYDHGRSCTRGSRFCSVKTSGVGVGAAELSKVEFY